ncbi:MAG TPA: substrate-binding domain-containing protein [Spirochaetia bacterium]|nr:substrate-binding domain-containing protein [Spirochaetia bacterium]
MNSKIDFTTKPLLRDKITDSLRSFISLERGDRPVRIEAERDLAERLNVSRLSLRAAVQTLVDEGLLLRRRGSGTYIVPIPSPQMVDLIAAPDIKPQDPFYSEFLSEFSRYLAEHSLHLRMLHPDQLPPAATSNPLIVVGLVDSELMRELRATHSRVIATQSYPDAIEISQICFDDYRIGSEAASILHERGHRRIIHLSGPQIYPSAQYRRQGFVDRTSSFGGRVEVVEGKMNWESGHRLGERVIRQARGQQPVTAVFAVNDWMALGLMQRLREGGVRVPDDVSVIGCDDIHLSREVKPYLSTFNWDMTYLIRELFSLLKSMDGSGSSFHKKTLLPARFVERDSLTSL